MTTIHEVTIYRQASIVFEHLIEPAKLRQWVEDLVSATELSKLASGEPYQQVIRLGWREEPMTGRVTEFIRGERFAYTISTPAWSLEVSYRLQPSQDGSSTCLVAHERTIAVGLLAKLMNFLLSGASKRKQAEDLTRLKEYLDRGGDLK